MNIKPIGVEEWLNELETSATLDIAQSTIASLTTDEILALADDEQGGPGMGARAFYDELGSKKQNYGWIEGSPDFKQEVAALYQGVDGRGIDPHNVLQMNGATGANLAVLYTLVNPGDHVVVEYPTYQPLYEIPRTLGAKVDLWRIHEEDGWQPRIEELERLVTPDTKLICTNNASNPTGTVLSREQLEAIAQIVRSVGAYVLSDEVHLPLEDRDSYCSIVDVYERGIATNSLSKTYSVPGIRIGWTVCDAEIADRLRTCRDYSLICAGSSTTPWPSTSCVIATSFWRVTATLCSATAPSCRNGSLASRARAGCRHAACPRRLSAWIFPWTMRRFAESCSRPVVCCWSPVVASSCRAALAWAIARKRRHCAAVWTSFPARCAS